MRRDKLCARPKDRQKKTGHVARRVEQGGFTSGRRGTQSIPAAHNAAGKGYKLKYNHQSSSLNGAQLCVKCMARLCILEVCFFDSFQEEVFENADPFGMTAFFGVHEIHFHRQSGGIGQYLNDILVLVDHVVGQGSYTGAGFDGLTYARDGIEHNCVRRDILRFDFSDPE